MNKVLIKWFLGRTLITGKFPIIHSKIRIYLCFDIIYINKLSNCYKYFVYLIAL
jgi:hypothetical protein